MTEKKVITAGSAMECAKRLGFSESSITRMVKRSIKGMVADKADEIEGKDDMHGKGMRK